MVATRIFKRIQLRHENAILSHLNESQYWTPKQVRQFQFLKIKRLLKHAFQYVPYYRKVAEQNKIKADDIREFKDFERLPILTKDIIRKNFNSLLAENVSSSERIFNSTGGSTGEPLHFYQDLRYEAWANAARIRGWYHIAGCNYWDRTAVIWGAMHEVKSDFSIWERVRDFIVFGDVMLNAFNLSYERKRKFLTYCRLTKPKLLRGYTTAIKDMASFLEESGQKFPHVKGIILCAESVDRYTQRYIERIFNAPSYNTYGGRELSLIGMECVSQNGLHEISENNYVEYEPVKLAGYENAGNLIITNLNNYAMPFIRYKIGDIGIPGEEGMCRCGRGLPRIKRVVGRTTEVFTFPDGTKIAGEMFIHLMKDFPISEYQFVQKSPRSIVLKHKKEDHVDNDLKLKITQTYVGYLPDGVALEFQEVEHFEKTPTGKFRFVLKDFTS